MRTRAALPAQWQWESDLPIALVGLSLPLQFHVDGENISNVHHVAG